jgi:hypothetical protein
LNQAWLAPLRVIRTPGPTWMIKNQLTGAIHAIDPSLCRSLLPGFGGSHPSDSDNRPSDRQAIDEALRLGLYVHERELLDHIRAAPDVTPCGVAAVAVVTRDRPRSLQRFLRTSMNIRRDFRRSYRIVVIDQSSLTNARQVRSIVDEACATDGNCVEYFGNDEIALLSASLVRRGVARPDTLSFLLSGAPFSQDTYGAALNSAVLCTAGAGVALFDDDIVADVCLPESHLSDALSFADDGDPTSLRVYRTGRHALAALSPTRTDAIAHHDALLGASLSHVARLFGSRCSASPGALKVMRAGERSHIAITAFGIAGDCGLWSLHPYAMREPSEDTPQFSGTEQGYTELRTSRQVIRSARVTAITGGGFFMNAAVALDNREPLAPFCPVFRNMDGVFAQCFQMCLPNAFMAFLPHTVFHRPPSSERRLAARRLFSDCANAGMVRPSDLLIHALRLHNAAATDASDADRRQAIGHHLHSFASLGSRAVAGLCRDWTEQILASHLWSMQRQLELTARAPAARLWRQDLVNQMAAVKKALGTPDNNSCGYGSGFEAPPMDFARVMSTIADGFLAWDNIWEEARAICGDSSRQLHRVGGKH